MRIYELSPDEIRRLAQDLRDAQRFDLRVRVAIQGDAGPIVKVSEGMWCAPLGTLTSGTETDHA